VNTPPTIETHPLTQTAQEGHAVSFSVQATSPAGTLSYQWKKAGVDIGGKTAQTLDFSSVTLADAGNYSVLVTNTLNGTTTSATSNTAVLGVNPTPTLPVIATHPVSQTIVSGNPVTFSVNASASAGELSYQWRKGGIPIVGETTDSCTLPSVQAASAGSFDVLVTSSLSGVSLTTTSNAAVLSVNTPPTIETHPLTQTAQEGHAVSFSVQATSPAGTLSYQWKKDGVDIGGKTAQTLDFSSVTLADAGNYSVLVTNTLNGTTTTALSQAAALTVNPAAAGPTITGQPQSKTVIVPSGNTFSVEATGTGLTYQWKKNGANIGTNSASYTVSATDLNEVSAQYSVVVTDSSNASVTSENATLTVMAPEPTYAGDPVPTTVGRSLTTLPSFQTDTAFPHGSFRFGYDEALKNPAWTSYANFKFISAISFVDNDPFTEDTRLALPRVGDGDYSGSGWTRGHNVMQSDIGYRYGQKGGDDSCRMSNIAPQIADLNNNFWNKLEQAVGGTNPTSWVPGLADKFGRIWIYTGPTFSSTPATFSSKNIAIPNGFYKIVVYETTPGQPKALAVLAPHQITSNTPPTATALPYADIWKYVTSVARVEQLTGLDFFPNPAVTLPTSFKTEVDVLGLGSPFEQTGKPNVHMVEPSWNISVSAGTTVNFQGAASSNTGTISNPTWTFGTEGTATGLTASHTFNTAGSVTVSFTATDGASVTNTITRVITVTGGNAAPTLSGIGAQGAVLANPVDVAFTVGDDSTPLNNLVVTGTSSNPTVLPDTSIVLVSGPDSLTGACTLRLTGTGSLGTATVTVHVTDANAATTTGTFTFTVTDGNSAPVITGLSAKTTPTDTPITVDFTVSDAETAAGSLTVTATSNNTTLIPGTLSVTNTNGACSLLLTPGTGLSGSATLTISVTDGGGKTTTGTFGLTVGTPAAPKLIISQYYEGASNDKWVELTNVGAEDASLLGIYLAVLANANADSPDGKTPDQANLLTSILTGGQTTLAPGATLLFKHTSAALPSYATGIACSAAGGFNGDDIVFLTSAADTTAWSKRTDVIGDGSSWGTNQSFYRKSTIVSPNPVYTASEWTQASNATVDAAASGTSERLGEHIYTH
jgi:DNA/RNA endonuclease G (NUC1)